MHKLEKKEHKNNRQRAKVGERWKLLYHPRGRTSLFFFFFLFPFLLSVLPKILKAVYELTLYKNMYMQYVKKTHMLLQSLFCSNNSFIQTSLTSEYDNISHNKQQGVNSTGKTTLENKIKHISCTISKSSKLSTLFWKIIHTSCHMILTFDQNICMFYNSRIAWPVKLLYLFWVSLNVSFKMLKSSVQKEKLIILS